MSDAPPGWPPPPPPHAWAPPPGAGPAAGPTAAPPGSRYDEQARNGRQNPVGRIVEVLMVLLFVGCATVVAVVVSEVVALGFGIGSADPDSEQLFTDPLADQAAGLLSIAVAIPAVLLAVRWFGHRPPGTVSSVTGRLRAGWLGRCALVAFPLMALQLGLLMLWSYLADDPDGAADTPRAAGFDDWPMLLLSILVLWALVPFQAAAEEYVFRGWLVQAFGAWVRTPWPGIVVASLLFALAHGLGEKTGFALLLYSAMWWGWLTVRTGGLEASIALHTANNALTYTVAAVLGELADTGTAADAPWQALVLELLFAPAYCLLIARTATRRGIDRTTPKGPSVLPPLPKAA
ncbi:CPBP family intramembrane glutamic endopeptidase [Streptomyces sp. NPDC004111]|uniref:CPBP family intramembrane glutamic endopeptidase n=1 Tax=Streptomyces sp. NPDC004111 TaxID=3364690 RepID=UPI0036BF7083